MMSTLKQLFNGLQLPEIVGVDFGSMNHADIANLLPAFGGSHPTKAILIEKETGKAYGIASGWDAATLTYEGMRFQSGAITPAVANQAGAPWALLGNQVESVAAAFMRAKGITEAALYINGRNPCWGCPDGTGCYYRLPVFLEEGSILTVYNKYGQNVLVSQPQRPFRFTGWPD